MTRSSGVSAENSIALLHPLTKPHPASAAVLTPNCIFAPTHASQVAAAVKIFADHGCEFAVRGGGHSAVPGAANIDDGILITYENMKNISMHLDSNPQYVSIEPGLVWGEVYEYVEKFKKVPLCGRFFPVGTGLALGAGFSFLFNEYGFAVDNVHTYEMVLANGSLVEVNRHNFPDLFHAQKGGGNNFGVVTRYDLLLKEGGLVVGGEVIAPENQTEQWLDLVYDYSTRQAVQDVKTHALPAIAWVGQGDLVVSETPVYYNDHNSSTLPPVMSGWVKDIQLIGNTVRQTNYSSLATEYATGFGDGLLYDHPLNCIAFANGLAAKNNERTLSMLTELSMLMPGIRFLHGHDQSATWTASTSSTAICQ